MRLLYFAPASYGGIADYAHEQANALVDLGVNVTFLCESTYSLGRGEKYRAIPILKDYSSLKNLSSKYLKVPRYAIINLGNFSKIADFIEEGDFNYVLFGSYLEYLAPIWSPRFRQLAKRGVVFGAVIHDPSGRYVFGPNWWHRWSVASAYSFLQVGFVHQDVLLDTGYLMPNLKTCVIPHGLYDFGSATSDKEAIRAKLDLPVHAKVLLSFGHLRDNKNLDLVLQAMVHLPDVYLIVAGQEQLSSQRPVSFYKQMAVDLGIAERCRWLHRFIPSTEIPDLFTVCDLSVLTYDKSFQSASGVLNTAAKFQKLCVASSGDGPLKSMLDKYNLGVWVEPDDSNAIVKGIEQVFSSPPNPQWDTYIEENSWARNAQLVIEAFDREDSFRKAISKAK